MRTFLSAGTLAVLAALLAAAPAPAVEKADVDRAVKGGVEALRQAQEASSGAWRGTQDVGLTSLVALALMECDVPPTDKAIQQAAAFVRKGAITEKQTYSLALAIIFLDRMGEPGDVALIESMTVRLLGGQSGQGGWNYDCPGPSPREQERLEKVLKQLAESGGKREAPKEGDAKRTVKDLPPEIQEQLQNLQRGQNPGAGDNSNTQFATLGLWVARRHGLPTEPALQRVEQRFRGTQNADGGWPYTFQPRPEPHHSDSMATMTAAAVMCIAVADATYNDLHKDKPADISKDRNLMGGLTVLSRIVGHPVQKQREMGGPGAIPQVGHHSFYFLWSLERVCVALSIDKIGGKDWWTWGAEVILANQGQNGTWDGRTNGALADTSFALLFLRKANLAGDLTANLKGKLGDVTEVTLKSGSGNLKETSMRPLDGKGAKGNPSGGANTGAKPIDEKSDQGKLAKEVVSADGAKRDKMIEEYRDAKGVKYTEALATAIPHLTGDAKVYARDALAERLARMKADTLTNYLKDEDAEIRRGAALACALKESKSHVPLLIEMLRETDPAVERAVLAALKDLTKQNFGPPANATAEERDKAIAAWKDWWAKQK
jgi:hypothetical protein